MDESQVPKRIRMLRESRNLSQLEFGAAVGARPETISRWERGKTTPTLSEMIRIAECFKYSLDWFAGVEQDAGQRGANAAERAEQTVYQMQEVLKGLLDELVQARLRFVPPINDVELEAAASTLPKSAVGKKRGKPIKVPRKAAS